MDTSEEFDSLDPAPEKFRELGYETVNMMADHFAQVREIDTFPDVTPSEAADEFDDPLPVDGEDYETVLADITEQICDRWYQRGDSPRKPRPVTAACGNERSREPKTRKRGCLPRAGWGVLYGPL